MHKIPALALMPACLAVMLCLMAVPVQAQPAVGGGGSFVTGARLPALKGDFLFAALRGERLVRVRLDSVNPRRVLDVLPLDLVTAPKTRR